MPRISSPAHAAGPHVQARRSRHRCGRRACRAESNPWRRPPRIAEVPGGVGGFAGLCSVPGDVDEPVLVSGTDGVGTKLKVAFATGVYQTRSDSTSSACASTTSSRAGRVRFFFSTTSRRASSTSPLPRRSSRESLRRAGESGCALLGGETAELPGMYAEGEYDLAGFAVGVVARRKLVDGTRVSGGRRGVGAAVEGGLHSNGYSLARTALLDAMKLDFGDRRPPELGGKTVGEVLLTPTSPLRASGSSFR